MFILSCSRAAEKRGGAVQNTRTVTEVSAAGQGDGVPGELQLPAIPPTITDAEARAGFLISRYWDSLDFTDTRLSLDTAFMEQSFANFISLFPHAAPADRRHAMAALVERASASGEASAFVMEIAEKYLADPNSPMRSDSLYILYARAALEGAGLPEVRTARMAWLLEGAEKNLPGTAAPDFPMTLTSGARTTLRAELRKAPRTLVMFYDPDCDNCKAGVAALRASAVVDALIAAGALRVLAVYPDGSDRALWLDGAGEMPGAWTVACGDGAIEERDLYRLPALPAFYLMDSSRILLKDAPLPAVESTLAE